MRCASWSGLSQTSEAVIKMKMAQWWNDRQGGPEAGILYRMNLILGLNSSLVCEKKASSGPDESRLELI